MVYKSIEYMNTYQYEAAETIVNTALHRLHKLYVDETDQSVNTGDKDMVKVEILMYFVLAKNYFDRANHYLENFDYTNEANKKLALCTEAVEKQMTLIEQYLEKKTSFSSQFEEMELQNEYIYAIGQLGKTKNKEVVDKRLANVSAILKDEYKFDLVQAFIETQFEDFAHAKEHYEKALAVNPKNTVALRGLGFLNFHKGDLDLARKYLKELKAISPMHIFQAHMYDVKVERALAKIAFREGHILRGLRSLYKAHMYRVANRKTLKKMYVI